jgi:DnaJ family protein C protein 19
VLVSRLLHSWLVLGNLLPWRVVTANKGIQGRAGLVAMRRYRGGAAGALGKAYYKGGFEPKMNRREAALILQLKFVPLDPWKQMLD